jgi:Tfp pilus assembly protein PilF/4-amino-4-deoxy-L-arabinose transferase-like glycosyltransferase
MSERCQIRAGFVILIVIVVSPSFCYLLLAAWYNPDVPFLRTLPQAEWIVRYSPPDTDGKSSDPAYSVTDFSRKFDLKSIPQNVRLHIRAFRAYRLWVNRSESARGRQTPANWKKTDVFDIASLLRPGTNTIEVRVTCSYGPPALWLYTTGLKPDIRTDNAWSAFVHGSPPVNAAIANDCTVQPAGLDGPTPLNALHQNLPMLALVFSVCCIIFGLYTYCHTNVGFDRQRLVRACTFTPRFVLILSIAAWVVVFAVNARHIRLDLGFDAAAHIKYIQYLFVRHAVPLANQGWQAYQPPLFYVLSALLLSWARLVLSNQVAQMTLKIIPFLSGLGQIFVAYFTGRMVFVDDKNKQMLCTAFAALIPMNIYMSHYISNEPTSALLIALVILVAIMILRQKSSVKLVCILAVLAALALLTKFTAFVVLPVVAMVLLYKLISEERTTFIRAAGYLGLTVAIIFILAGWFYLRNWVDFGKPLVGNWDPVLSFNWWQDPGFHTYGYFCRFGDVFTAPWLSGFSSFFDSFYATFWGDSLLGGRSTYILGPPWNYEYIAVVYMLAVPATLLIIFGALQAFRAVVSRGDKIWLMILALLFVTLFSSIYMSLRIAHYSQSKAFYCLFIVVPISLTFASGFDVFDRWLRDKHFFPGRVILYGWFGTLMFAILMAFIVRPAQENRFLNLPALARQGRLDEAVTYYTTLITNNPDNPYTHYELAKSYGLQRRYQEAVRHFEKAIELKPDWSDAYRTLGRTWFLVGNVSRGISCLHRAVELNPADVGALNNLAMALATAEDPNLRNLPDAVKYAQRACELTKYNRPFFLDTLAVAYASAGNFGDAVKTAQRAIELAEAGGQHELADQIKERLVLYKSNRPYRSP